MSHPHLTSLAFDRTGTELLASYGGMLLCLAARSVLSLTGLVVCGFVVAGDYIYLLSLAGGADGVTLAEGMEMEGGIRAASPTGPQRGDEAEGCGDAMNSQPTTSSPKRKRKRTRSEEAADMEEDEDDEKHEQEVNDENEEDDDMDEHSEREEEEEGEEEDEEGEEESNEGEEEDEDISSLSDDDADDPWALEDDEDSGLDEDPRIRTSRPHRSPLPRDYRLIGSPFLQAIPT
jgi:hypothetical protein